MCCMNYTIPTRSPHVTFFHGNKNQDFDFDYGLSICPRVVRTTLQIHDLENFHQTNDNTPYLIGPSIRNDLNWTYEPINHILKQT